MLYRSNMRIIMYARHKDGYWVSRVDSEFAWPILDYEAIGKGDPETGLRPGNFRGPMKYNLERLSTMQVVIEEYRLLTFTKKVSIEVKNFHRKFWGMRPTHCPRCMRTNRCSDLCDITIKTRGKHAAL